MTSVSRRCIFFLTLLLLDICASCIRNHLLSILGGIFFFFSFYVCLNWIHPHVLIEIRWTLKMLRGVWAKKVASKREGFFSCIPTDTKSDRRIMRNFTIFSEYWDINNNQNKYWSKSILRSNSFQTKYQMIGEIVKKKAIKSLKAYRHISNDIRFIEKSNRHIHINGISRDLRFKNINKNPSLSSRIPLSLLFFHTEYLTIPHSPDSTNMKYKEDSGEYSSQKKNSKLNKIHSYL